jgi:hypothetical protein
MCCRIRLKCSAGPFCRCRSFVVVVDPLVGHASNLHGPNQHSGRVVNEPVEGD